MTDVSGDGEIVPILQKLIAQYNEAQEQVVAYLDQRADLEEKVGKPAYTARKAARNRIAELLQAEGLEGFSFQ